MNRRRWDEMLKRQTRALTLALVSCVALAHLGTRAAEPAGLKEQAVARLAASHDPAIFIAVGRVYVKQAGLLEAHRLLAERGRAAGLGADWSPRAVAWMDAQAKLTELIDDTIARRIEDPAWFRTAWGAAAAAVLSAEEADAIATHFASEGGAQQRGVLELLLVGETLLARYTFTERIRYDVAGAEREMRQLQDTWWVNDHRRVYDFTRYPNAIRFASQDPGVKYSKMLAIQGIDALNRHFDAVADEVRAQVRSESARVDAAVARHRSAQGAR